MLQALVSVPCPLVRIVWLGIIAARVRLDLHLGVAPLQVRPVAFLVARARQETGTMKWCHPESKKRESRLRYWSPA